MTDWIAEARARCDATPPDERERLGRIVRDVWVEWAREQPEPKASWLVPWDGLSEPDREVDRRIGERLSAECPARTDLPRALDALERVRALCDEADGWGVGNPEVRLYTRDLRAALDGDA